MKKNNILYALIIVVVLSLVWICLDTLGVFNYPATEWQTGTIINCDHQSYYSNEYVGNWLVGYRWKDVYQGSRQHLQITTSEGKILKTEWDADLHPHTYQFPYGTKVRFRGYKQPFKDEILYYQLEPL